MIVTKFGVIQPFAGWLFSGSGIGVIVSVWFAVSHCKGSKHVVGCIYFIVQSDFRIKEMKWFLVG